MVSKLTVRYRRDISYAYTLTYSQMLGDFIHEVILTSLFASLTASLRPTASAYVLCYEAVRFAHSLASAFGLRFL